MSSVRPTAEPAAEVVGPTEQRLEETLRILRTLFEDDEAEQRQTFAYLQRVIEEDRPSTRHRFRDP
jgi:hypothetical protein